jgi:hypothetical protein
MLADRFARRLVEGADHEIGDGSSLQVGRTLHYPLEEDGNAGLEALSLGSR